MRNTYNDKTKEITTITSVEEYRCMGIAMSLALGGPGLAQHMLNGVVNAADETSTDEDYKNKVEEFFDNVKSEHIDSDNPAQVQVLELLRNMALALPRTVIIAEHYRQMGTSAPESFNA